MTERVREKAMRERNERKQREKRERAREQERRARPEVVSYNQNEYDSRKEGSLFPSSFSRFPALGFETVVSCRLES